MLLLHHWSAIEAGNSDSLWIMYLDDFEQVRCSGGFDHHQPSLTITNKHQLYNII